MSTTQQELTRVTPEIGVMSITPPERQNAHEMLDKLIDGGMVCSTHDPNIAAAMMEFARKRHILLTEALGAFRMQPGWELAFTKLQVDTDPKAKLVYSVSNYDDEGGGRDWNASTLLSFHKPLLNMVRTHLGIDLVDKIRIDDQSSPLNFEFKGIGKYISIDGRERTLVAIGGLDLRDGSPAAEKVMAEARGKTEEEKRRKGLGNLMRMRAKVMQRADTNCEERLIWSYGFRSSYTKGELDNKLIVCVRPIETGYHPDPEIQKMLIQNILNRRTMAQNALYGAPPAQSLPPAISTETAERLVAATGAHTIQNQLTGEPEPTEPEVKQCTPDVCYGQGSNHVKACSLPVNETAKTKAAEPDNAWVIPGKGPARGLRINDPKVTPETLFALRKEYAEAINPEGELRDKLNDEAVDFYSSALREVQKEIQRRNLKDEETKY